MEPWGDATLRHEKGGIGRGGASLLSSFVGRPFPYWLASAWMGSKTPIAGWRAMSSDTTVTRTERSSKRRRKPSLTALRGLVFGGSVPLRMETADRSKTRALLSTGFGSHRLSAAKGSSFTGVAAFPTRVRPASPRPCNMHTASPSTGCWTSSKGMGACWARGPAPRASCD